RSQVEGAGPTVLEIQQRVPAAQVGQRVYPACLRRRDEGRTSGILSAVRLIVGRLVVGRLVVGRLVVGRLASRRAVTLIGPRSDYVLGHASPPGRATQQQP